MDKEVIVPRDVLMAALNEVNTKYMEICGAQFGDEYIAAIADRYASKVQPEPVNQQMLAALKACLSDDFDTPKPSCKTWHIREQAKAAIAAAELSGNSGQLPADEAAQPVAVPDGVVRATELAAAAIYLADSSDYLSALWGILRFLSPDIASLAESDTRAAWERAEQERAMLSAAQREGGE